MMSFKAYKPASVIKSQHVVISISPTGKFGISVLCYQKYILPAKQIELYYDATNQLIGIKPLQQPSDNGVNVVKSERNHDIGFSSRKFLKACNISINRLTRFEPT